MVFAMPSGLKIGSEQRLLVHIKAADFCIFNVGGVGTQVHAERVGGALLDLRDRSPQLVILMSLCDLQSVLGQDRSLVEASVGVGLTAREVAEAAALLEREPHRDAGYSPPPPPSASPPPSGPSGESGR